MSLPYNVTIGELGSSATPIMLHAPLTVKPAFSAPRFAGTVNGSWTPTDIASSGPSTAVVDCRSIAFSQDDLNQLWEWFHNRTLLDLIDEAAGTGVSNAYFYQYTVYIMQMPEAVMSPFKMDCESFNIIFAIVEVTGRL